jgi:hypothetical protein
MDYVTFYNYQGRPNRFSTCEERTSARAAVCGYAMRFQPVGDRLIVIRRVRRPNFEHAEAERHLFFIYLFPRLSSPISEKFGISSTSKLAIETARPQIRSDRQERNETSG